MSQIPVTQHSTECSHGCASTNTCFILKLASFHLIRVTNASSKINAHLYPARIVPNTDQCLFPKTHLLFFIETYLMFLCMVIESIEPRILQVNYIMILQMSYYDGEGAFLNWGHEKEEHGRCWKKKKENRDTFIFHKATSGPWAFVVPPSNNFLPLGCTARRRYLPSVHSPPLISIVSLELLSNGFLPRCYLHSLSTPFPSPSLLPCDLRITPLHSSRPASLVLSFFPPILHITPRPSPQPTTVFDTSNHALHLHPLYVALSARPVLPISHSPFHTIHHHFP